MALMTSEMVICQDENATSPLPGGTPFIDVHQILKKEEIITHKTFPNKAPFGKGVKIGKESKNGKWRKNQNFHGKNSLTGN